MMMAVHANASTVDLIVFPTVNRFRTVLHVTYAVRLCPNQSVIIAFTKMLFAPIGIFAIHVNKPTT